MDNTTSNSTNNNPINFAKNLAAFVGIVASLFTVANEISSQPSIGFLVAFIGCVVITVYFVTKKYFREVLMGWLCMGVLILVWNTFFSTANVSGKVYLNGVSVKDETIILIDRNGVQRTASTTKIGSYEFQNIPKGKFSVSVGDVTIVGEADPPFTYNLDFEVGKLSGNIIAIPTSTVAPIETIVPTITVVPTITPLPKIFEFSAPICQYKSEYLGLNGDRIILRNDEFTSLNLPIGSLVKLSVEIDGQTSFVNDLILDNDVQLTDCALLLNKPTRDQLSSLFNDELDIKDISKRRSFIWKIEYQNK